MMVNWCLLTLTALLCCVKDINAATYTMLVDDRDQGPNGAYRAQRTLITAVACKISGVAENAIIQKIVTSGRAPLPVSGVTRIFQNPFSYLNFTLTGPDELYDVITYQCTDGSASSCPDYAQVTISFSHVPDPGAVIAHCPPGGSYTPSVNPPSSPSSSPSNRPSTQSPSNDGTAGPRFAGLNPLIYTISAVILLGTLAIVAIITCWIRARRSYNRRMFQSSANPQDYLDYISDNEFTPLTTSEFVASLQERPPTYNESEEIEGQVRPEGDNSETGAGGGGTEGGRAEEGREGAQATTATTTTTTTAATSTSTNARSRPPRPPPPLTIPNSNYSQPSTATTTSSSSGTAVAATTSSNGDAPGVTNENRPPVAHGDGNDGEVPDITGDSAATGALSSEPVLSGIDALLSMDLSIGNGNGTEALPTLPVSSCSTSATESAAVGTLIDFGTSNTDTSAPVVSSSQSTFHSLPQPTPEQISEMEAAIGALNEHMTRIRERTE